MLQNSVKLGIFRSKVFLISISKYSVQAVNVSKKDEYYKKLGAQTNDSKPADWDTALPFEDIPGPKPLPIIGNVWRFFPLIGPYYNVPMDKVLSNLQKEYGNIAVLKGLLGKNPMVLLYDPDDIEHCLRNEGPFPIRKSNDGISYHRQHLRKDVYKGNGGLLVLQGEEWFKFRTIINPILMQPRTAQQYVESMDKVANQLVANMKVYSEQNGNKEMPADFLNELYKWGLESIGVIALDTHLGCLDLNLPKDSEGQKLIACVTEMLDLMLKIEVLPPIWKIFPTPSFKRYVELLDFSTNITLKYVEEAMKKSVKEDIPDYELSVLQRLAKVDKHVAITMAMDMLMAGIETTGKTLGAALYFLARNPEKQECLRKELLKNLPEKCTPITKETLTNCSYLKAAIKETTRLAPITMGNVRTSVKDLVLGGFKVPKGTEIISMHLVLSHQSDKFKDAKEFVPERWLRTTNDDYSYKNAHPFSTMPFGFGVRTCVGKRLANLELEVAISKIISNFKLSWHHEDMVFSAKLLYGLKNPLKLRVESL